MERSDEAKAMRIAHTAMDREIKTRKFGHDTGEKEDKSKKKEQSQEKTERNRKKKKERKPTKSIQ